MNNQNYKMETQAVINIAMGVGCGICIGWVLQKRLFSVPAATKMMSMSQVMGATGEAKLVLVVRNDLKMGKGKIAAQCSHAAVMAYDTLSRTDSKYLNIWRSSGQPKVVTKVESEEEMIKVAQHAKTLGLNASVVKDAGRTQIAPGTLTVVGVGPGPKDLVDQVTGHLKLL